MADNLRARRAAEIAVVPVACAVAASGLELVTCRQVVERRGLGAMRRPEQASGYATDPSRPR